ncbi:fiber 2 protein [Southern Psittacara leucophthalmus aviadenovirus]|uniref:Fiber 2 protein n=1 Tax=Southern Psittacara leucophthalmus aviadenovirus TaxID=2604330 RepID=A0AAF1DB87_9ADEN|nr:fiber 2 protein [Southern Psittacara leucophthalmus aviadenovirus]QEJ80783.1 fiber 2 protein [Southern Psittacara leucophthalmus aviadenovirus]
MNYPFWYSIQEPELNPPLLNPNGPLYQEDGMLKLRLTKPVAVVSGGVGLKTDGTLASNSAGELGLKVAALSGISQTDNGLSALVDGTTVRFNEKGELTAIASGVQVDPEGPIENGDGGLNLRINDTLEVDTQWELGVKLNPTGCVDYDTNGVNVNIDDTLLIEANAEGTKHELGVNLNPAGPITADEQGLDLEIDNTSLVVNQVNEQGVLAVKLGLLGGLEMKADGVGIKVANGQPLLLKADGVSLNLDTSLGDTSSALGVRFKQGGAIATDADGVYVICAAPIVSGPTGIGLAYDTATLAVEDGKLKVLAQGGGGTVQVDNKSIVVKDGAIALNLKAGGPIEVTQENGVFLLFNTRDFINDLSSGLQLRTSIEYLSPYCVCVSGDRSMRTITAVATARNGNKWNISHYAVMANSSGVVNCSLCVCVKQASVGSLGSAPPEGNNSVQFTVILNPSMDDAAQHSQITTNSYYPNVDDTKSFLTPSMGLADDLALPTIAGKTSNWYNGGNNSDKPGTIINYCPYGSGTYYQNSTLRYFVGRVSASIVCAVAVVYDMRCDGDFYSGSTIELRSGYQPLQWISAKPSYLDTQ